MDDLAILSSWLVKNSVGIETALFYCLATIAIPLAYGVIFDKTIIRSGFLLIGVFGSISGLFLLLQAQFIAMAQIMIYAVGITLVVVIALMLTNPRQEQEIARQSPHRLSAFFVCLLLFITIYMAVCSEELSPLAESVDQQNNVRVLGQELTTDYALPFEFSSVLLLAALMGAILLAKSDRRVDPESQELVDALDDGESRRSPEMITTR